MSLCVTTGYEELQHQFEELGNQGYYYVGEYIFAGSHRECNKINADAFHLWDIHHGDELDRIVMLFADLSAGKAATLVIEGRRVCRNEFENGRFLVDAFKAMGTSVHAERAKDLECTQITTPIRLIYPKPLFLMLLYRCNLLLEGHSLFSLWGDGTAQRNVDERKDNLLIENIRQELRDHFEPGGWEERIDFRDSEYDHDSLTKQICELSKYLDGLQVLRQHLTETDTAGDDMSSFVAWKKRCQRVDDMISIIKSKLRQRARSSRMKIPFANPEHTIALWRVEEKFPDDMSFGEMVHIRTELEHMLDDLNRRKPTEETPKRCALWKYRMGIACEQIVRMEELLQEKLQDFELEWEDYLV